MKDILKSNSLCSSEGWQHLAQELLNKLTIEIERATLRENNLESNIQNINNILNNFYNKSEIVELLGLLNIIIEDIVELGNSNAVTSNAVALALADKVFYINLNIKPNTEDRILSNKTSLEIKEAINAGKTLLISGVFPSLGTSLYVLDPISPTPMVKILTIDSSNKLYVLNINSLGEGTIQKINLQVDTQLDTTSNNAVSNAAVTLALNTLKNDTEILRFDGIIEDAIIEEGTSEVSGGIYYSTTNKLFLKDSGLADNTYFRNWNAYGNYKDSTKYNGASTLYKNKLYAIVTNKLDLYMYSSSLEKLVNVTDSILSTLTLYINHTNNAISNLQPLIGTITNVIPFNNSDSYVGICSLLPWDILTALKDGKTVILLEDSFIKGAMLVTYAYEGGEQQGSQGTNPIDLRLNSNAGYLGFIGNQLYNVEIISSGNRPYNIMFTPIKNTMPKFIEILDSAATQHPDSVNRPGYYIYNNNQGVPAIFKYDGEWTELTASVLPKAYVIWSNTLWSFENGQLTDPVPYGGSSGGGTEGEVSVPDIYEINYVVSSVNNLPDNADPMEIALVNNVLEGTLTLYRKLPGIGWEESVPDGNYIYDNKVYKCTDGSVSKVVNEIVKNFSPKAFYRCYSVEQKSIPEDVLFINNNTLFISHNNNLVEYGGDPNALYYLVPGNMLFTVVGSSPSSHLRPYYEDITKIYEVEEMDTDNYIPDEGTYNDGYYIFKRESDNMPVLYSHGKEYNSWEEIVPLKAYIVYNNVVYLYKTDTTGYRYLIETNVSLHGGVVVVSRWGGVLADGTSVGQYGYNTQLKKLYKWSGFNWSEVSAKSNVIYINLQTNKQYRWNGSDMVELSGGTQVQANWNQSDPDALDYIKNKPAIEENIEEDSDETLYPEYWLNEDPVYAKNYYDWNLVRYKCGIATPQNVQDISANAEVLYPTEHLNDYGSYVQGLRNTSTTPYKLIPQDVFFDEDNNRFLLKIGDNYYTSWNNSSLWQRDNGLREDTIYCATDAGDASVGVMYKIVQWIYINGQRKLITSNEALQICTDFSQAFADCLAANNGNMRLHGNRIYGITSGIGSITYNNFTIDGQGATICYIPRRRKTPQGTSSNDGNPAGQVIYLNSSNSCVVKNLKIKGVRTSVRNVASGYPFSYSSTDVYGIHCYDCSDVRLENVEFSGMGYDIGITGHDSSGSYHVTDKVVIKGWKSKASEGIFMKLVNNLIIDGADIEQGKYSSKHLLYCNDSRFAGNHVIKNSKIIQNSIYNPNFIQYKTSQSNASIDSATNKLRVSNLTFYNCLLQVSCGTLNATSKNTFNFNIDHCVVMQHSQKYDGSIGYWASGSVYKTNYVGRATALIATNSWCNLTIKDSQFISWGAIVYLHNQENDSLNDSPDVDDPVVKIEDSSFILLDPANYSNYASSKFIENDGIKIILLEVSNMGGHDYFFETKNIKANVDHILQPNKLYVEEAVKEINKVAELDSSASDTLPKGLPVGYSYFNTTVNKPLWIVSVALDGTYSWVDATGTPYTDSGQQANI